MLTIAIYSEKGGVGKTSTTVGLAAAAAARGMKTGVVDLDPQFDATTWLYVDPKEPWHHTGSILADEDPEGWAAQLAVPAGWRAPEDLQVVASHAEVSLREQAIGDLMDGRLRSALRGWDREVVFIDVPNRKGGPLITNALVAADMVLVPLTMTQSSGIDALASAVANVRRIAQSPWNPGIHVAGCLFQLEPNILSRDQRRVVETVREEGDAPVFGSVPARKIVPESRAALEWWGNYDVEDARAMCSVYDAILDRTLAAAPSVTR